MDKPLSRRGLLMRSHNKESQFYLFPLASFGLSLVLIVGKQRQTLNPSFDVH